MRPLFFIGCLFVILTGNAQSAVHVAQRELNAPAAIKSRLAALRSEIQQRKLTFTVGYTTAMDIPIEKLAATRAPANLPNLARNQNELAARMLAMDRAAVESLKVKQPHIKIPDLEMIACQANQSKFDWRTLNKVTPVRNQDGCGSCWDFAALGAYEGSFAIRNNSLIDASEQEVLSCSGAGSCGGGWWMGVFNYLIQTGTSSEQSDPYTSSDTPCPPNLPNGFRAVAWGFVDPSAGIPSVPAMKQALCEHGPLAVAVYVSPAFQAYTGGVFNEHDTSHDINHGVTLIGWDDSKSAWLIKNSWGAGWGETGGMGTEHGYMWIAYGSNKIGNHAAWVQARSNWIVLPAQYFRTLPNIKPMPPAEKIVAR